MSDDPVFPPDGEDAPEEEARLTPEASEPAGAQPQIEPGPWEPPTEAQAPPLAAGPPWTTPEESPAPPPLPLAPPSMPAQPGPGPAGMKGRRDERPRTPRGPRPDLTESAEPLYRESAGYRMRLEPADLSRLRELPGSKGKTDRELGEIFFDGQTDRFTASLAEDVPSPAEVRVVVDPYSRQAFLAVEKKIRSILSF
jgi:hypothetical protein